MFYHFIQDVNLEVFGGSVLSIYYQYLSANTSTCLFNFFIKHLYVLMSWNGDMDVLWIIFLSMFLFSVLQT